MITLEYEMTYAETIDGPLGPTSGSPLGERLCWQVTTATLHGPRIEATLAMPGTDWIRLGPDGIRRQDLRAQFVEEAPPGWLPMLEATLAYGVTRQTLMQRVKRGELRAVHVRTGRRKGLRIEPPTPQNPLF